MSRDLDAINRKILAVLQKDGRISVSDLAQQVGLSPTPCLRRIRQMEEDGTIARYVAIIDQTRVGLPVNVFALIKLDKRPREEGMRLFTKEVSRWQEVIACHLMTGAIDYLLHVVVADLRAYERFLKDKLTRLDYVASVESSFSLEQVKYTTVLPISADKS